MSRTQFIGSLSQYVSHSSTSRNKKPLSQQLREERELLFGNKRRVRKKLLPASRRKTEDKHNVPTLEIVRTSAEQIIKIIGTSFEESNLDNFVITIDDLVFGSTYGQSKFLEEYGYTNIRKVWKQLTFYRTLICYLLNQCYGYKQYPIAELFRVYRDFTGQAHRVLIPRFEHNREYEKKFYEIFDKLMKLNNREYQ
jgi:hypothetical protein